MRDLGRTAAREMARQWLARHETDVDQRANLKAGLGAIVGMVAVGQLAIFTGLPLLIAPLGSTSVLLFGQPSSPLAQPVNVMGGYLVATIACELAFNVFPGVWVAAAVALGLAIVVMRALRVTHPPAGAMPILGFGGAVHGPTLFMIVFLGCVALIALATVIHRIPPLRQYPLKPVDRD